MPAMQPFGYRQDKANCNLKHRRVSIDGISFRMQYDHWRKFHSLKLYDEALYRDNYQFYRRFWDKRYPELDSTPLCQFFVRRDD